MIAVFGAFGRTGSVVVERARRAARVRLVTRSARHKQVPEGAELAVASLLDEVGIEVALRGASAAYVVLPDDFSSHAFHAERRAMADAMARALRRAATPRIVLLSSTAAVEGEHAKTGFGADLAYLEKSLLGLSATITILRAPYFQDNVIGALATAAHEGVYANLFGSRDIPLSTIASADVGAIAARTLLETPRAQHEIVDLFGPAYSPSQMAAVVSAVVGRELTILDVPREEQPQLLERWMSPQAARAMALTLAYLGSNGGKYEGQRRERAETPLGDVLRVAYDLRREPSEGVTV